MSQRMFTVTPRQAKAEVLHCMNAGVTPLLTSSPGMGKSSLMREIANEYDLELIDLRLSQCTPEDLQGFPMRQGNRASFTPFDVFPLEDDELPEGKNGWLIFLDELTSASKPVQAAAYKLILDRMVGSHRLHDHVVIAAAGNKLSDKAVVNQISTALQSRLIHFELEVSMKEWVDYAHKAGIDHRIIGYIEYQPSKLMDFRPDHHDTTFPCPRTWEFLSRLIKDEEVNQSSGARIAGTIGEGTAVEFITFAKEMNRLPKLEQIIKEPTQTRVPDEAATKYACVSMLIDRLTAKNLDPVLQYIDRFPIELQIVFIRGAVTKPLVETAKSESFRNFKVKMVKYLDS